MQRQAFQTVNNILKLQEVIDTGIQADKWTQRDNPGRDPRTHSHFEHDRGGRNQTEY